MLLLSAGTACLGGLEVLPPILTTTGRVYQNETVLYPVGGMNMLAVRILCVDGCLGNRMRGQDYEAIVRPEIG